MRLRAHSEPEAATREANQSNRAVSAAQAHALRAELTSIEARRTQTFEIRSAYSPSGSKYPPSVEHLEAPEPLEVSAHLQTTRAALKKDPSFELCVQAGAEISRGIETCHNNEFDPQSDAYRSKLPQ